MIDWLSIMYMSTVDNNEQKCFLRQRRRLVVKWINDVLFIIYNKKREDFLFLLNSLKNKSNNLTKNITLSLIFIA